MADMRETLLCLLATLCFHFPSNVFQYLLFPSVFSISYVCLLSVFSLGFGSGCVADTRETLLCLLATVCFHFPSSVFQCHVFPFSVVHFLRVFTRCFLSWFWEWLCGRYKGDTLSVSNTVFPLNILITSCVSMVLSLFPLCVISLVLREWLCGPY